MKRIALMLTCTLLAALAGGQDEAPDNVWELESDTNLVTEQTTIRISKMADQTNQSTAGAVFLYNPNERSQNGKPALSGCAFLVGGRIETSVTRVGEGIYQTEITLKLGDELRSENANVILKTGNLAYPSSLNCTLLSISLGRGEAIGAVIPMAAGPDAQLILEPGNFAAVYETLP